MKWLLLALTTCLGFVSLGEDALSDVYFGASATLTLPQGGHDRMRRLGGVAFRGGAYVSDFIALEGEAAALENAVGLAAQALIHWQACDVYDQLFGYSQFDPFFTLGAKGFLAHDFGDVGPNVGIGAFYHLTDTLSLRFDSSATLGLDGDAKMTYALNAGVQYSF